MHTPEVSGFVRFDRAAPAGADRVDQHKIREGKPGIRVVAQTRSRGIPAVRPKIENARPDKTQMEKSRSRAWPPIEYKSKRTLFCAIFQNIGGIENRRALLTGLVEESEGACGRRIGKLAARRVDRVLGDRIGRQEAQHAFIRRVPLGWILRAVFGDVFSAGGTERAGDHHRQQPSETEVRRCHWHARLQ